MWPGGCFRVILNRKGRQGLVPEALEGPVIQIDMRDINIAWRQAVRINYKSMILGGDFHRPGGQVPDRVIGTVMAEFQFACFSP